MSIEPVNRREFSQTKGRSLELRRHRRYPIALALEYKWNQSGGAGYLGSGTTVNISSGGVLFRSTESLPARSAIEIALSWPFSLQDCALKLVMRGHVVRSDSHATAVKIQQYEFRTAGGGSPRLPIERRRVLPRTRTSE